MLLAGDTLQNKVWQIRVSEEWLEWLKVAAKTKELSAAAYLRMVATDRMIADAIPKPPKKPKKPRDQL